MNLGFTDDLCLERSFHYESQNDDFFFPIIPASLLAGIFLFKNFPWGWVGRMNRQAEHREFLGQ